MARVWRKVEMTPIWDFSKNKELIGIYLSREEGVGPNESVLYTFETENGEIVGIWGNSVVEDKLKFVAVGAEVKIVYLGKATSEKSGREYRNFEVFFKVDSDESKES